MLAKAFFKTWDWLYFLMLAACILLIPHYTFKGYSWGESGDVVLETIRVSVLPYLFLAPLLHVLTLVLLIGIAVKGNAVRRVFAGYFAMNYALIMFSQGIGTTEKFGFTVVIGTVAAIGLIALLWTWEAIWPKNETQFKRIPLWRYWVVPFAVFAFWKPSPAFEFEKLLTSGYGIEFCFTTPVVLAFMSLIYPKVNRLLFQTLGIVGTVIGMLNMYSWFNPSVSRLWLGVLHFPLLFVSIFALVLPYLPEKWLVRDEH